MGARGTFGAVQVPPSPCSPWSDWGSQQPSALAIQGNSCALGAPVPEEGETLVALS